MGDKVILLDMDGVLVDFVGGAYKHHRRPMPDAVPWKIWETMGIDEKEFWEPLGYDFWAGLDWTPDGKELVHNLQAMVGVHRIALLTSPCLTPGCAEGKLAWIKRHLPQFERQYLLGPAKQFAAGPGKILVDDHYPNVEKFREAGGQAVLVPRPWNSLGSALDGEASLTHTLRAVASQLLS